jgi:hypothetical protein
MPPLQYWFSGAALFLAGSFVLGVVLGLIGIKDAISHKVIALLFAASLALLFMGWKSAARQEQQSVKRDADNDEMKRTVGDIAASMGITGYASVDDLKAKIATAEARSRRDFLGALTRNYILSHDGISSEMMAGLELPPQDWLNDQLEKYGKPWRVRTGKGPAFETYDVAKP